MISYQNMKYLAYMHCSMIEYGWLPLISLDYLLGSMLFAIRFPSSWTSSLTSIFSLRFHRQQERNRSIRWSLPDNYAVSYAYAIAETLRAHNLTENGDDGPIISDNVIYVGGVYLQLYVSQTAGRWMLRQPEVFLEALMNRLLESLNRKSSATDPPGMLRIMSRAALKLLNDRPGLLDGFPKKGYAHRILDVCPGVQEPEEAKTCALLINAMSASKVSLLSELLLVIFFNSYVWVQ